MSDNVNSQIEMSRRRAIIELAVDLESDHPKLFNFLTCPSKLDCSERHGVHVQQGEWLHIDTLIERLISATRVEHAEIRRSALIAITALSDLRQIGETPRDHFFSLSSEQRRKISERLLQVVEENADDGSLELAVSSYFRFSQSDVVDSEIVRIRLIKIIAPTNQMQCRDLLDLLRRKPVSQFPSAAVPTLTDLLVYLLNEDCNSELLEEVLRTLEWLGNHASSAVPALLSLIGKFVSHRDGSPCGNERLLRKTAHTLTSINPDLWCNLRILEEFWQRHRIQQLVPDKEVRNTLLETCWGQIGGQESCANSSRTV